MGKHLLPSRFSQIIFKTIVLAPFSTWVVQNISLLPISPCWGVAGWGTFPKFSFWVKTSFPRVNPGLGASNQAEGDFKGVSWERGVSIREAAGGGVRSSPGWLGLGMFSWTSWAFSQLQLASALGAAKAGKIWNFSKCFLLPEKVSGCFILVFTDLLEKSWGFFLNVEDFHGWRPGIWPLFLVASWVSRENRDLGESGCFLRSGGGETIS